MGKPLAAFSAALEQGNWPLMEGSCFEGQRHLCINNDVQTFTAIF